MIGSNCRGVYATATPGSAQARGAGAWHRRTKGVAPVGVGSGGVLSGSVRSGGVRASAAGEEWPELLGESPGVGVRELAGVKIGIMS